jgi:hypothetical protein
MRRSGKKGQLSRGNGELFGEFGPGVAELARHADQGGVEAQPGFGADDHQIEPVGQAELKLLGPFVGCIPQIDPRGVEAEHSRRAGRDEAKLGRHRHQMQHVNVDDSQCAEQEWQADLRK